MVIDRTVEDVASRSGDNLAPEATPVVHLHLQNTEALSEDTFQEALQILSADERERCDRLHFKDSRRDFVAAHALLRRSLSAYTARHSPPETWSFETGLRGKPALSQMSTANEVIEFNNVSKGYGDRLLIDNLSFIVPPGAIIGIIGPNGAGKSTLFRMIAGKEKPDSGEVKIGHTVNLAVVDQTRKFPDKKNVWEVLSDGQDILTIGKFEIQSRAYAGRFNFRGQDQQKLVGNLSGGERGRLHLAKTLLAGGNVLLLDEPSNDLDVETLRALEDALTEFAGTCMVVSHDRWFLDRICTHILAAEGDSQWYFYTGNYREYEEDKHERLGDEAAAPHRLRFKPLH